MTKCLPCCRWFRMDTGRHHRAKEHLHCQCENRSWPGRNLWQWPSRWEHCIFHQDHPSSHSYQRPERNDHQMCEAVAQYPAARQHTGSDTGTSSPAGLGDHWRRFPHLDRRRRTEHHVVCSRVERDRQRQCQSEPIIFYINTLLTFITNLISFNVI